MNTAVLILSIAGAIAVVLRIVAAAMIALRGGLDAFVAGDVADTRLRRGDITGSQDALSTRAAAKRRRMVALGVALMWTGLLVVPSLTPWPRLFYAGYAVLWLVPRRTLSSRTP